MKLPIMDYTFYRLFSTFKRWKNYIPVSSAISVMIIILGGIVTYLLEQFNLIQYLPDRIYLLFFFGLIYIIFYFLYARNKRYISIEERFAKETKKQKVYGTIFLVVIALFTIGAYFGVFIIE